MLDFIILEKLRKLHEESYYHSIRVSHLCFQVAKIAGMELNQCLIAERSGLLHDIGKLRIPCNILSKKDPLTQAEYEFVQQHVQFGVLILKELGYEQNIIDAIEGHHEREDGHGYPHHMIPKDIITKVVAVCDVFDAMTEDRSYRESLPKDYVLEQMKAGNLGHFHNEILEALRLNIHR